MDSTQSLTHWQGESGVIIILGTGVTQAERDSLTADLKAHG
jgi:hypothetical protein